MHPLLLVAGLAGLIYYGRRWTRSSSNAHSERDPLHRWEDEGGAVPTGSNRTAAQVSPAGEAATESR